MKCKRAIRLSHHRFFSSIDRLRATLYAFLSRCWSGHKVHDMMWFIQNLCCKFFAYFFYGLPKWNLSHRSWLKWEPYGLSVVSSWFRCIFVGPEMEFQIWKHQPDFCTNHFWSRTVCVVFLSFFCASSSSSSSLSFIWPQRIKIVRSLKWHLIPFFRSIAAKPKMNIMMSHFRPKINRLLLLLCAAEHFVHTVVRRHSTMGTFNRCCIHFSSLLFPFHSSNIVSCCWIERKSILSQPYRIYR